MHEPRMTRKIEVELSYVAPGSYVNRRFVSPGRKVNTGRYETHRVESVACVLTAAAGLSAGAMRRAYGQSRRRYTEHPVHRR